MRGYSLERPAAVRKLGRVGGLVRSLRLRLAAALCVASGTILAAPASTWVLAAHKKSTTPIGSGPAAPPLAPLLPASGEAGDIARLFYIILAESGVVFVFVVIFLGINILRYSHKSGQDEEPPQVFGNRRIEIAWTVIPAIMLAVAFVLTIIVMNQVDNPVKAAGSTKVGLPAHTPVKLTAIGHQWWWEFRFPQFHVITANEIHIPVHTTVRVDTTSVDVIHSFWIPQLDRQMDATPNNHTILYINADRTGIFPGACYEFCGQGHAWMQFRVVVDTPSKFKAWIAHEAATASVPTSALPGEGQSLFFSQSCASCHTISGTPANGKAAPNLSHVGSRWGIAGGVLPMSEQNLERWIHDPQLYKPGALMPPFALSKHQLHALAAYVIGLK